jgi:hypothetical protein
MKSMFHAAIWWSRKKNAAVEWAIDGQHAPHHILDVSQRLKSQPSMEWSFAFSS